MITVTAGFMVKHFKYKVAVIAVGPLAGCPQSTEVLPGQPYKPDVFNKPIMFCQSIV